MIDIIKEEKRNGNNDDDKDDVVVAKVYDLHFGRSNKTLNDIFLGQFGFNSF